MREFDSKHGYDRNAMEEMIARVQDIKASPVPGKKRLVVKEEGAARSHAVIDIDMNVARDVVRAQSRPRNNREPSLLDAEREAQRKPKPYNPNEGKYIFKVEERDDSKNPGFQRKKSAEFRAYDCHEKPTPYEAGMDTSRRMNRFGGGGDSKSSGRIKF